RSARRSVSPSTSLRSRTKRSRSASVIRWRRFACRSSISYPRSRSASALSALAALGYLAAYGARMPLLAFRGLLRVRNIALVLVPAVVIGAIGLALQGRVDERIAAGALAVAIVPAPLVGPGIVGRMRGRADLTGALGLGTTL